ncbi:MAG: hypothetical protein ACXAD7_09525 [Candidatus Kariarchaeaceae archaeon]|jgi:hypothetical protein
MVNSKENMRVYFLPVYFIWAIISPTLIVLVNGMPWSRVPAFYALFGLIWPITFVVYPAFLKAFTDETAAALYVGSVNLAIPVFYIAWLGPVVHLVLTFIFHKRSLEKESSTPISWSDYFFGFI